MALTSEIIIKNYPTLYHMAHIDSWNSIREHGLLSTEALLDLYKISDGERIRIISQHRKESIKIENDEYGVAVIRDQKPMSDSALQKCLGDQLTPNEWYEILNGKVFFWLTEARLIRMLNAGAYRGNNHIVLEINTELLLAHHESDTLLSPINSGATVFKPQPRGRSTFLPISDYPYEEWMRKRNGNDAIVELVVKYGVTKIIDYIENVSIRNSEGMRKIIWAKE